MYNSYFGFAESPFENSLDQRFLFLSEDHQEVLAALLYFVKAKKSFALVCGDVGTGKTMLINSFLQRLPQSVQPVIVSNPFLDSQDLLLYLAKTLEIPTAKSEALLDLTDKIKEALVEARAQDRQVVLIVDEAHLLSDQTLEEIRLLSNLETPAEKLLQILLVGQYELSYKLDRPEMRHLRQRVNVNRFLSPLNPQETVEYIDHRLHQVGSHFGAVFEPKCRKLIFKMTQGMPRQINLICDNALLIAMAEGLQKVSPQILKKAQEAAKTDLILTPKSPGRRGGFFERFVSLQSTVVALMAILLLVVISFRGDFWWKQLQERWSQPPELTGNSTETKVSSSEPPKTRDLPPLAKKEPLIPLEEQKVEAQAPDFVRHFTAPMAREENPGLAAAVNSDIVPQATHNPSVSMGPIPARQNLIHFSKAQGGESLIRLANRYYRVNKELGYAAIILANPEIADEDRIRQGQSLNLPIINFSSRTFRLQDGLFYAIYARYNTAASAEKLASQLRNEGVRVRVRDTVDSRGNEAYRIFLGGYNTEADLVKVLKELKKPEDGLARGD